MTLILNDWPESQLGPAWVTIGKFDSVHLGHQKLIEELIEHAKADDVQSIVLTFWPHPKVYFDQKTEDFILNNREEKRALLIKTGVDRILCLPFNQQLAEMTAEEFLSKLNGLVPLKGLLVGERFALGKDKGGTGKALQDICDRLGFPCIHIPPVLLDGEVVSSQRIRRELDAGRVDCVARLLGRPYSLSGNVAPGNKLGSKLGFPTANLYFDVQRKLPRFGVYATRVELEGKTYQGVTSVGVRPTFQDGNFPSVETLLLDFNQDIYGKLMTVNFVKYLRDEVKYDQIQDLIDQIEQDKIDARRALSHGF